MRGDKIQIQNNGKIKLGDKVLLYSSARGHPYICGLYTNKKNAEINIGNQSRISGANIFCRNKIIIGNHCRIGPGTIIADNDFDMNSINPTMQFKWKNKEKPIIIGNNVWIGMHSIISKGVTIGDNTIIASGSIVTTDVPSNCMIGGNPATIIKKLNG